MKSTEKNMKEIKITLDDVKGFLQEQGYNWSGYACPYDTLFDEYHMKFLSNYEELNAAHVVLLMGSDKDWGNRVQVLKENVHARRIENKFVKFAKITRMEFGLYLPEQDNSLRIDDGGQKFELEKDLTREWIRFLATRYESYLDYVIARCKYGKLNIVAKARHTIKEIEKTIRNLREKIKKVNDNKNSELARYDRTLEIANEVMAELEDGETNQVGD